MKTMNNKSMGKKSGIPLRGGGPSNVGNTARTGPQAPGVTGVSKGASNKRFGADPGGRSSIGNTSTGPQPAGQTGRGGGSTSMARKVRKGAGQDDAGNPL